MQITAAGANDLDAAYAVLLECRQALEAQGLMQWDPQYPSESFFVEAIASNSLFVLSDNGSIHGVVVLDETQAPEWSAAAWQIQEPPFLVIHAFAIAPPVQGRGFGGQLLRFCESIAMARSCTSIRLDAFSENASALAFYQKHGYIFRDEVRFASKPIAHQLYYCYEKSMVASGQRVEPDDAIQRTR